MPEPVAYYPLNGEYEAAEKFNRQPQGILGDAALTTGPYSERHGAYEFFANSTSFIKFPNDGGLDTRHSITLMCWVQPGGQDGPLFNYGESKPWGVRMWVVNGTFFSGTTEYPGHTLLNAAVTCTSQKALTLTVGEWVHVAATYNNNTGENSLYINGSLAKSQNTGEEYDISTHDAKVRMGATNDDERYFKGNISQMHVYGVALDGAQIKAVMKQGKVIFNLIFILIKDYFFSGMTALQLVRLLIFSFKQTAVFHVCCKSGEN